MERSNEQCYAKVVLINWWLRSWNACDLNTHVNPAVFKILLLVMNSNVCILYMSIFCIPSIYDRIDNHKCIFSSSWIQHQLCFLRPVAHTSCQIHSGTRRSTTVGNEDFSGVSKRCNHKPPTSTEELSHHSGNAFGPCAAGCSEMSCRHHPWRCAEPE